MRAERPRILRIGSVLIALILVIGTLSGFTDPEDTQTQEGPEFVYSAEDDDSEYDEDYAESSDDEEDEGELIWRLPGHPAEPSDEDSKDGGRSGAAGVYSDTFPTSDSVGSEFVFTNGTITGYSGPGGDVVIPSEINGVTVETIGQGSFENNKDIESVVIPDSIKTIGSYAFKNCSNLSLVTFLGQTSLQYQSFYSIGYPAVILCYEEYASHYRSALYDVLGVSRVLEYIYDSSNPEPGPTGDYTFSNGTISEYKGSDVHVIVPEEINGEAVTAIGARTFENNTDIEAITIPSNVTTAGERFVSGCTSLQEIYILGQLELPYNPFGTTTNLTFYTYMEFQDYNWVQIKNGTSSYHMVIMDPLYEHNGGVITKYIGDTIDVEIPSRLIGNTITKIDSSAFEGAEITSVTIPGTVESIGDHAFKNCARLSTVIFEGDNVPALGEFVFEGCPDIHIVCHIDYEDYLLDYFGAGSTHTIETFGERTPIDTEDLRYQLTVDGYKVIGYYGDGGAVEIPDTVNGKPVVGIGDNAFNGMGASTETMGRMYITSITMPDSVTYIGDWAFAKNSRLTSITLSNNLVSIGANAFVYCHKLTEITIPSSVKTISELAFTMMHDLENINVEAANGSYKDIDGVLFSADGTELVAYPAGKSDSSYVIPEGVELIHKQAFALDPDNIAQSALLEVIFPESLRKIDDSAFMQSSLEHVTIYPGVKLGEYVFQISTNMKSVTVAEGVTELPKGTFYALENAEEIKLPSTLKTIGYRAFDRCGTSYIELPEGLEEIGEDAFEGSYIEELVIPSTLTTLGDRAFYSSKALKKVTFREGSQLTYISKYAFNQCKLLETVELPDSITMLDDGAFSLCYALTSIDLPSSITTMGNSVFSMSGLESIKLPDSITAIGSATFRESGIQSVTMPAYLETLGTCTFEHCKALTEVNFPGTIKLDTVPMDTFFYADGLRYVYLPQSIASTQACSFSYTKDLVIEYANRSLERSVFDTFALDPGEYYYIDDDGEIYTNFPVDSDNKIIFADDNSNGAFDEDKLNYQSDDTDTTDNGDSVTKSRDSLGQYATCACGIGSNGKLSATSNPTFKYRSTASNQSARSTSSGGSGQDVYGTIPVPGVAAALPDAAESGQPATSGSPSAYSGGYSPATGFSAAALPDALGGDSEDTGTNRSTPVADAITPPAAIQGEDALDALLTIPDALEPLAASAGASSSTSVIVVLSSVAALAVIAGGLIMRKKKTTSNAG